MEPTDKTFVYIPLSHVTDTRVVELLPGSFEDPIECQLRNVEIHNVDYEAISYVWGDPGDQIAITCESRRLSIPRSLAIALKYMRYTDRSRILWCDSISINQADKVEKSYHVGNMGKIYGSAQCVLLWQGEGDENTRGALAALTGLMKVLREGPGSASFQTVLEHGRYATAHTMVKGGDTYLQSLRSPDYLKVANLLQTRYFSRLWTLQEGILAKESVLVLGHETCSFAFMRLCSEAFAARRLEPGPFLDALRSIFSKVVSDDDRANVQLANLFLMFEAAAPSRIADWDDTSHLMALIKMTVMRECTDPRDSIYALLDLAADVDSKVHTLLRPDYTARLDEVYHRTAVFLIVQRKSYNWLAYAKGRFDDDTPSLLVPVRTEPWIAAATSPSWVPLKQSLSTLNTIDYRGTCARYWQRGGGSSTKGFSAGTSAEQEAEISSDHQKLTMTGFFIDRVAPDFTDPKVPLFPLPSEVQNGLYKATKALNPKPDEVTMLLCLCLYEMLLGCFGDAWKTGELPLEALILHARCHQFFTEISVKDVAGLYSRTIMRLQQSYRGEVVDIEDALKDVERLNRMVNVLVGSSNFKLRPTENGRWALLPHNAKTGDMIAILHGMSTPLVLSAVDGEYKVVGDCAVDGFMDGEALQLADRQVERITLV